MPTFKQDDIVERRTFTFREDTGGHHGFKHYEMDLIKVAGHGWLTWSAWRPEEPPAEIWQKDIVEYLQKLDGGEAYGPMDKRELSETVPRDRKI